MFCVDDFQSLFASPSETFSLLSPKEGESNMGLVKNRKVVTRPKFQTYNTLFEGSSNHGTPTGPSSTPCISLLVNLRTFSKSRHFSDIPGDRNTLVYLSTVNSLLTIMGNFLTMSKICLGNYI